MKVIYKLRTIILYFIIWYYEKYVNIFLCSIKIKYFTIKFKKIRICQNMHNKILYKESLGHEIYTYCGIN